MSVKKILSEVEIVLSDKEFKEMKRQVNEFIELLKKYIAKNKIDADVFLGGSFAKNTVALSEEYDADVFVRFDWKYEELSDRLEKVLKGVVKEGGFNLLRLHGSRDYFKVFKSRDFTFEVIPVKRIKKTREADNVTDLSYFHVRSVKRKMKKESAREIALAKKFFKCGGVYGAESYIHGFSGYGVECLVLHYGSFEKMLKALVKVKIGERLILDPDKHYKKKDNVLFELNEGKLHSPVILVDPTWKERNVLASLNWETFEKFQNLARNFLKNPSKKFFEKKEFDVSKMKKKKGEFLEIVLKTDRQEGDIAGTKMKKFSRYLEKELARYFFVLDKAFNYSGEGQSSEFYLILKSRGEVLREGPPVENKKWCEEFKKRNKGVIEQKGKLFVKEKIDFSGREFLKKMFREKRKQIEGMGIFGMVVN